MSEFHVYIQTNLAFEGGYRVYLMERAGSQTLLHTQDRRLVLLAEGTAAEYGDYFCDLPRGAAHAFLGALSRELGAVEHPEQLRSDFEALRGRHDKLVDHLMDEARRRPAR